MQDPATACFTRCLGRVRVPVGISSREHKTHQLISFHPVLLGGVHRASGAWAAAACGGVSASVVILARYLGGNEPPRTLPAKVAYMELDIARTARYQGVSGVAQPAFFPASTVMAQRILCYVKATLPQPAFEQTLLSFFRSLWVLPHADISKPDVVRGVLDKLHLYSEAQIDAILAAPAQKERKDCLTNNTRRVVELGAFGAPWISIRTEKCSGSYMVRTGSGRFKKNSLASDLEPDLKSV
ncbi:unnamed protein product [Mycena citricolor]|uniref:DSBA-like thioredoxin domain-containing protein n=1 Tax=Mycena citricolor TaxID=2018698 RepID=A0AAD2HT11_9AGAR|nr:unnamed protein product [Mycena citricolor]